MGYFEAVEDGIRNYQPHGALETFYFPKCHICGEEVKSIKYQRGMQYTCKVCRLNDYLSDKERRVETNTEVKNRKLENALQRVKKDAGPRINYDKAESVVRKHLHTDGWFDSTEEIMAALELIRRNIKVRHQVKFGRYTADFVLLDERIVLEVDGIIYHGKERHDKEVLRDNLIILSLTPEWEVVRITDELINQNIRGLVPAIRQVKNARQKVRSKNNGQLPEWYSSRKV